MYDKIVNPISGRKVNITGKLGKQILQNYLNQISHTGGKSCGRITKKSHDVFAPLVCTQTKGKGICDHLTCRQHDCIWVYNENKCRKLTKKRLRENGPLLEEEAIGLGNDFTNAFKNYMDSDF